MSSVTRPRGPLPRRVYWARRLVVLAVLVLLVMGFAKVLGAGSDGDPGAAKATTVAGSPTPSGTPTATASGTPAGLTKAQRQAQRRAAERVQRKAAREALRAQQEAALAQPSGPCPVSDVVVTPSTANARAGGNVPITLLVTTKVADACTFVVSPQTVVLKLTSGQDRIWSSQQCPKAIPVTTVVARKQEPGKAVVTWHGHRSNDECSLSAPWALPGYYHAEAAALGSDPTDVQFQLQLPERPTITPKPKVKKPKNG